MKKTLESYIQTADIETIDAGMQWYSSAYEQCRLLASKYSTSPVLVASIVAALSPRNKWARNLIDAENVISHKFCNTPLKKCAVYNAMLRKALSLCDESLTFEQREVILNGRKIQSFFLNICGISNRVTIDSWIDLAYAGKYKATKNRKALGLPRYRKIEQDFIKLSEKYACKPYQLQAIVWLNFQEKVKNEKVNFKCTKK